MTVARAIISRMSALSVLLEALAAARRSGEEFDSAWEAASALALGASCDPADWRAVLDGTRDGWEAAYRRLPASSSERALTLLAWDAELADVGRQSPVGDSDTGRVCRHCDQPISPERGRRAPAFFCSTRCRQAWHRGRARERVAA